jgi:hypothetical protein
MQELGPSIEDFENALKQCSANLYIMYKNNGGDETSRTVIALLSNIAILSPYLEEVLGAIRDSAFDRLAAPIEKAIELAKLKGN